MIGVSLFACMAVIIFMTVMYEIQMKKIRRAYDNAVDYSMKMIINRERLITDYQILLDILLEIYTEEELDKIFIKKKEETVRKLLQRNEAYNNDKRE